MAGLATTINAAIGKLFGSVSANRSERRGYSIMVGPLGGICKTIMLPK